MLSKITNDCILFQFRKMVELSGRLTISLEIFRLVTIHGSKSRVVYLFVNVRHLELRHDPRAVACKSRDWMTQSTAYCFAWVMTHMKIS